MSGLWGALTGAAVACVYCGHLWISASRIAERAANAAALRFGLASLARMVLVGAVLFALAKLGSDGALGGLVGFMLVRAGVVASIGGYRYGK